MDDVQKEKWYKDKYTLIFIAILIVAIGIRFYYFTITAHQTSWWDSCDYLGAAKAYAGIGFASLTGQRLPGYPFFVSLFFRMGIKDEVILGFLVNFIPSIVMLILLYFTVCRMYKDKRIALISMAIMAFLCESMFYSNRFQTENFGLIFQFISLMCMYNFLNKKNAFWLAIAGAFAMISVFMRPGQMLFIPSVVLFLIITQWKEHKAIVIISVGIMLLTAVGLMMFVPSFNYIISSNMNTNHLGPAWNSIGFVEGMFSPWLNLFFYLGFGLTICYLIIGRKNGGYLDEEETARKSDIFNILLIITVLFAFMFIIRAPNYEFRWFFPLIIASLVFISKGIVEFGDTIATITKIKFVSVIIILVVLGAGLYSQVSNADMIIKNKVNTYDDVKKAALWMKDNTVISDRLSSISYTQTAYYSERKVLSYAELNNSDQFVEFVMKTNPRFFTVSIFEPHPQWIYEWTNYAQQNNIIYPAAAWFTDNSKTQPTLITYGFIKDTETCSNESDMCSI